MPNAHKFRSSQQFVVSYSTACPCKKCSILLSAHKKIFAQGSVCVAIVYFDSTDTAQPELIEAGAAAAVES